MRPTKDANNDFVARINRKNEELLFQKITDEGIKYSEFISFGWMITTNEGSTLFASKAFASKYDIGVEGYVAPPDESVEIVVDDNDDQMIGPVG